MIKDIHSLKQYYQKIRGQILKRLKEFKKVGFNGTEKDIFSEFAFCLLTPQSKAKTCWAAIMELQKDNILFCGDVDGIRDKLNGIRFHNKKAEYILKARGCFLRKGKLQIKKYLKNCADVFRLREELVNNIKGMGYKEASHFLRNIGLGENFAILDRHILKNLKSLRVINNIPAYLNKNLYLDIEEKMRRFSKRIDIPLSHLDLLFWSEETGEIFK